MFLASARFIFFFTMLGGVLLVGVHALDMHGVDPEPFDQDRMTVFRGVTTMLPTVRGRGLQTGENTCRSSYFLRLPLDPDGHRSDMSARGIVVYDDGDLRSRDQLITGSFNQNAFFNSAGAQIGPYSQIFNDDSQSDATGIALSDAASEVALSDADRSVYITGNIKLNSWRRKAFLTKYSSSRRIKVWTKLLGNDTGNTQATGVAVSDVDGSVYITGRTVDNLDGETHIGIYWNAFLTKYSFSGDKKWTKLLGVDTGNTQATGVAVSDADGSIYISINTDRIDRAGYAVSNNAHITKYSSSGAKEWTKLLGVDGVNIQANALAVSDADGSVYITGYKDSGIGTSYNAFLTKYSSSGAKEWTKLFGSDTGNAEALAVAVSDVSGSVYITGRTDFVGSPLRTHSSNAFLTKYSSSGAKEWTQLLGVDGKITYATGVAVSNIDDSAYIMGSTDASRVRGWSAFIKHYGGTDLADADYGLSSENCLCDPNFDGCRTCSINIDCSGNASSVSFNRTYRNGIYSGTCRCICNDGFAGERCETNVNECIGQTCSYHGSCVDGVNSFTCVCNDGFAGERCEMNVDECIGQTCSAHGFCVDGVNSFTCVCNNGFSGDRCEKNIAYDRTQLFKTASLIILFSLFGICLAAIAFRCIYGAHSSTIFRGRQSYHDYSTSVFNEEHRLGYNRLGDGLRSPLIPNLNNALSRERFKSVEIQRLRKLVLESKEQNKEPNSFAHEPVAVAVPCASPLSVAVPCSPPKSYTERKEQDDDDDDDY
jgi:hypothetical protein